MVLHALTRIRPDLFRVALVIHRQGKLSFLIKEMRRGGDHVPRSGQKWFGRYLRGRVYVPGSGSTRLRRHVVSDRADVSAE
jgi:hypothetical protein